MPDLSSTLSLLLSISGARTSRLTGVIALWGLCPVLCERESGVEEVSEDDGVEGRDVDDGDAGAGDAGEEDTD